MTRRRKKAQAEVEIGLDGWPVDATDPANVATEESMEEYLERRHHWNWRRLQVAVEGGRIEAIAAAVRYACVRRESPPDWLVVAVDRLTELALKAKPGRSGRLPNPALHYARWELIEHLRTHHCFSKKDAIKEASKISAGTPERGEPGSFSDSHKEVQRAIKAGQFGRYAPFFPPD